MAAPTLRVRIGFQPNTFTLDDLIRGRLDEGNQLGGATTFTDVTSYVQSVNINRGRSRDINSFVAGTASIVLDNSTDGRFNPANASGPYYPGIEPLMEVIVDCLVAGESDYTVLYTGLVTDWQVQYPDKTTSKVQVSCSDQFLRLANVEVNSLSVSSTDSGSMISSILSNAQVLFSGSTSIDTGNSTMQAILDEPYILLYDGRINQVKELLPILESISQQNKSLLIIAEDIDGEALAAMIVNKMRSILKCCAVKAPDFGEKRTHILEDIATLTGGTVISKQKGMRLDKITFDQLGTARGITVEKDKTTIVDGNGSEKLITARLEEIKDQIERAESNFAIDSLQLRLSKMAGGVAIINVGGFTETEMKERKDRVDDALHATKAAIDEGVVPGGGVALIKVKEAFLDVISDLDNSDEQLGAEILLNAIEKPFIQILLNAGINKYHGILDKISKQKRKENIGYNIRTGEYSDFMEKGIIDPTKVTRTALENAVSVAGTMLITECTIVDELVKEKEGGVTAMPGANITL